MQPIFENRSRKLIDALHEKKVDTSENTEREIRGFEWLGESLLSLNEQDPVVFEVGHAFAARKAVLESKVEAAARILGFNNSPRYQSLSSQLRTLIGRTPVSHYNELKLYENPAFVTPDEEAFLRMRVTRNRSSEPLTFTQMFEDVCAHVRGLSFMKEQPDETIKRLVFENLFRRGRIREDIREMSSTNIGILIGDNLWECVKNLDTSKPLSLTEAVVSSDVETTAQSQGAAPETDKKYDFSPEEIQRLKDLFASGPLRYKPTVDNRLLRLSFIRYGKGGKHVEPVEGSWSDTYLDSGLLSSAEGPKKQTTQESLSVQTGQSGFVMIKCETPDEVDLVAAALDKHFEVYVDDNDPKMLKVRVYRLPNAEDQILSILKTAGLAGDVEDAEEETEPVSESREEDGLGQWVRDYQAARHSGNVRLAKAIKKNIDQAIVDRGLDAHEVYFQFGDPDDPQVRESIEEPFEDSVLHVADHPEDFLDIDVRVQNPDGTLVSESTYRQFLIDNDDETDGIPRELAFMEPGEVRNIGGGASPELVLFMRDKSGVWETRSPLSDADIALIAEEIVHYLKEPTLEMLRLRSSSGVSVADLVEARLGRRSYDQEQPERGKCHRKGRDAHKDRKLRKHLQMLLDKDKVREDESKKA